MADNEYDVFTIGLQRNVSDNDFGADADTDTDTDTDEDIIMTTGSVS